MKERVITSRDNALVRRARSVRDRKIDDLIFVEGVRLCEEAARADLRIEEVLYAEKLARDERAARLLRALKKSAQRMTIVSQEVLASVSDTKTPQGIILLAARPRTGPEELGKGVMGSGSGFGKEKRIHRPPAPGPR